MMFGAIGQSEDTNQVFQHRRPMAANTGFNPLVQPHFNALKGGRTFTFRFVAAGRQSVLDLKA